MSSNGTYSLSPSREEVLQNIADLLNGKQRGEAYQCHCPTHDDKQASLSLDLGSDGRILLYCHAGCGFNSIADKLETMGVPRGGLAPALNYESSVSKKRADYNKRIAATYDYRNPEGKLTYQTVRFEPKRFYQRRPDGLGGWINNLEGVVPLPYRLPDILVAIQQGERIVIVEGEKDADRLASLGIPATCNHGGAGKWTEHHTATLAGAADIVILPDNDEPGHRHAESIAASLKQAGISQIKLIMLPGLPAKGDISDWLNSGHALEELNRLIDATPIWTGPESAGYTVRSTRWRLLTADEAIAMPPIQWLVDGEIPAGGLTVLYGDSGSGKSFKALDYALHIAQNANVVYIAGEGMAGYPDRLLAWSHHHHKPLGGFHLVDEAIPMLNPSAVEEFIDVVSALRPKLIVIDTLARTMLGGDENSAKDMGLFIAACNLIQRTTGAAVLVVHHTGKNRGGERGSSALRGGADCMIELSNDDGLISITCAKTKDAEPFKTYCVRQVKVASRDGHESCVLLPADAVVVSEHLTAMQLQALDVLNWVTFVDVGCSARILAEQARIASGSIYRVLNSLMRHGYVRQASKGEPYYITPEGQEILIESSKGTGIISINDVSKHYHDSQPKVDSG